MIQKMQLLQNYAIVLILKLGKAVVTQRCMAVKALIK